MCGLLNSKMLCLACAPGVDTLCHEQPFTLSRMRYSWGFDQWDYFMLIHQRQTIAWFVYKKKTTSKRHLPFQIHTVGRCTFWYWKRLHVARTQLIRAHHGFNSTKAFRKICYWQLYSVTKWAHAQQFRLPGRCRLPPTIPKRAHHRRLHVSDVKVGPDCLFSISAQHQMTESRGMMGHETTIQGGARAGNDALRVKWFTGQPQRFYTIRAEVPELFCPWDTVRLF